MKGDAKVIQLLNQQLAIELTSINQYFCMRACLGKLGLEQLNKKILQEIIEDMKQADELIERILFLEGLPNLQN